MPCGCAKRLNKRQIPVMHDKKLTLDLMKDLTIDQIVELYRQGYRLESEENYIHQPLHQYTNQSLQQYTVLVTVVQGIGDVWVYRNGTLEWIVDQNTWHSFTANDGDVFRFDAKPGTDDVTRLPYFFQKYCLNTPCTGNNLSTTNPIEITVHENHTVNVYFCPTVILDTPSGNPVQGQQTQLGVVIVGGGVYNVDFINADTNDILASCLTGSSGMCTASWTPASAGTYRIKARVFETGCESDVYTVQVDEGGPPPPPPGCPDTMITDATPTSVYVGEQVALGVGIMPAGKYDVEFIDTNHNNNKVAGCHVGGPTWDSSTCIAYWTPQSGDVGSHDIQARIVGTNCVGNIETVTVMSPTTPVLTSAEISPTSASIAIGGSETFNAIARDQNGDPISGATITWAISDPSKVSIDKTTGPSTTATGIATTTTPVTLTATVVYNGVTKQATATITVTGETLTLTSVEVSPSSATVTPNDTQQFTAIPKDQNGDPMSGIPITWSLDNTNIGTIDSNGLFTASSTEGTGTITATATQGTITKTGTASITVSSIPPPPPSEGGLGTGMIIAAVAAVAALAYMSTQKTV